MKWAVLVVMLVLASSMVLAESFGGPGGTEFVLDCGEGYLINGIGGKEGALIDQLFVNCINPFKDEGQRRSIKEAGGKGGEDFAFFCHERKYVSKINMHKAGDFISGLQAVCTDGTKSKIFGTEQKGFDSLFCDAKNPALSTIAGKAGNFLDSISFDRSVCHIIPTAEDILNAKIPQEVRNAEAPIGLPEIGTETPTEENGVFTWNKEGVEIVYDGNNIVWNGTLSFPMNCTNFVFLSNQSFFQSSLHSAVMLM